MAVKARSRRPVGSLVARLCVVALASLVPLRGAAQLTEDEAVHRAMSRPEVRDAIEGDVDVSAGEALRARMWPNPVASYVREQTWGGSNRSAEDYALLTQSFEISGRRELRGEAADSRVQAARARGMSSRLVLEAEVRARFYELVALEARAAAVREALGRTEKLAAAIALRERAGDVSGYDRRRLEREHASFAARLAVEQARAGRARERLGGLLGEKTPVRVVGVLLPQEGLASPEALADRVGTRPDLLALADEVRAGRLEHQAAGRSWIPELVLTGGYKGIGLDAGRLNGFVAGVAIPLPILDRNQDEAMRGTGRAKAAKARLDLETDMAGAEVRGLRSEAVELASAARRFRADAAGTSLALTVTAEAAYRGGELGILELVDAHRGALDAETQAVDLEWAARKARIELDLAVGGAAR